LVAGLCLLGPVYPPVKLESGDIVFGVRVAALSEPGRDVRVAFNGRGQRTCNCPRDS